AEGIEHARNYFPALAQDINGVPIAYRDSGASSQQPECAIEQAAQYQRHDQANVHRGVHTLRHRAPEAYEGARESLLSVSYAATRSEVVSTSGTTGADNPVAQSWCRPRQEPGEKILITHLEHHSNIVPWQLVCEQTGAELVVCPINQSGEI